MPYSLYDYIVKKKFLNSHISLVYVFLSLLLWLLKEANADNEGFSSAEIRVTNVFLLESRPCYGKSSGIFNNASTSIRAMEDVYSIFTARLWWFPESETHKNMWAHARKWLYFIWMSIYFYSPAVHQSYIRGLLPGIYGSLASVTIWVFLPDQNLEWQWFFSASLSCLISLRKVTAFQFFLAFSWWKVRGDYFLVLYI